MRIKFGKFELEVGMTELWLIGVFVLAIVVTIVAE